MASKGIVEVFKELMDARLDYGVSVALATVVIGDEPPPSVLGHAEEALKTARIGFAQAIEDSVARGSYVFHEEMTDLVAHLRGTAE